MSRPSTRHRQAVPSQVACMMGEGRVEKMGENRNIRAM